VQQAITSIADMGRGFTRLAIIASYVRKQDAK
jgi:hypothetical protein